MKQDGFVNLNYGHYEAKYDKNGARTNKMHLTLGSASLKGNENIRNKLSKTVKSRDGKERFSVTYFDNASSSIINNALRFGKQKDGTVNFKRGLSDANMLESDMKVEGMFDGKSVERKKIAEIVGTVVQNPSEKLVDFITDTFK